MSERELATIQTIKDIQPIPNADAIVVATVRGWKVVVKKDEFNIGDNVIYVEVDALLPHTNPAFEFMRERKFRVKTAKLRGQISQGICFPMSLLPAGDYPVGTNVTETLGIVKYEIPIPENLRGKIKGNFPGFLVKTDQERVQNLEDLLEKYKGQQFGYTEKLDGSSFTAFVRDGVFGVCSRNLELEETEGNAYWKAARLEKVEEKLKAMGKNIAIQAEMIGMGIQGNKYAMNHLEIWVFDVYDIDTSTFYSNDEITEFCEVMQFKRVPFLGFVNMENNVDMLVDLANGKSKLNPKMNREGIVFRPLQEIRDPKFGRVSFKAISPVFLLKNEE